MVCFDQFGVAELLMVVDLFRVVVHEVMEVVDEHMWS
jgi:hypothetical protein